MLLAPRTEMQYSLESHSAVFLLNTWGMICVEIFQHPFLDMWFLKACGCFLENYKMLNSEITVLSTALGILCKYIFMKAGLCSQFFCSYCLLWSAVTVLHYIQANCSADKEENKGYVCCVMNNLYEQLRYRGTIV